MGDETSVCVVTSLIRLSVGLNNTLFSTTIHKKKPSGTSYRKQEEEKVVKDPERAVDKLPKKLNYLNNE
ncbi:unnamed protein product [Dovyalis caffra]|uniref:Ribosomal protein L33 n=1 Tax=Dovyalis caffra TaxID=77055 RepID=A0AAV1SGZ3_9ROSI|nr:unnamed protein product [Dovyalis caffra]